MYIYTKLYCINGFSYAEKGTKGMVHSVSINSSIRAEGIMGYVGYLCILFHPFLHSHFLALFCFVTVSMITFEIRAFNKGHLAQAFAFVCQNETTKAEFR